MTEKVIFVFAFIGLVFLSTAQTVKFTPFDNEKKLIEYGWDSPNIGFVKKSISEMEKKPFDGIIFKLSNNSVSWVFRLDPIDEKLLEQDLADAEGIEWNKFTDNFIILYCASEQDWFNDEHWALITEKAKKAAKIAKKAGCVGICFDQEAYGRNPWSFTDSAHVGTKTFTEYEEKVRERGAEFMKALESEFPGLTLLTFFQLSYVQAILWPMKAELRSDALSKHLYAFLPAFLNGMLDAISSDAQIVDGNECAYWYNDSSNYVGIYNQIMQRSRPLIAPENLKKYRQHVQVGQALYIDEYYGMRENGLGFHMTNDENNQWMQHNTYWALSTSDRYVWCYSEKMNWWTNQNVPPGCENSIRRAKQNLKDAWSGYIRVPTREVMQDIIKRATGKKNKK